MKVKDIILSVKPGETKELDLSSIKVSAGAFRARATELNIDAVKKGIMKKGDSLYSIFSKEPFHRLWIRNNLNQER